MMTEKPLSPSQVRALTGLSTQQIYRDLESGFCPGWKGRDGKGRSWKIDPDDLHVYKENLKRRTMQALRMKAEKASGEAKNLLKLRSEPKKSPGSDLDEIMNQFYPGKQKRKSI